MYRAYFGLNQKPFSLVPDPRFLFMSPRHKEALAHLLFGMGEGGGFVLLTGEVGTGKTTLCRSMLEQVPATVDVALVLNPKQTAVELLATICDELNVPYPQDADSAKRMTDVLNRHLLEARAGGRATVLVLDEAQNLDIQTLEQVRLLTNLETTSEKLLQIILIGQPELKTLMARPELRQLAQRITARCHLKPLSREETAAYIRHRLEIAGAGRPLFTRGALRLVHKISRGIPRLINVICDRAMLGAYAHQRQMVNRALVRTAAGEVLDEKWKPLSRRPLAWVMALLFLTALGLGWKLLPWPLPSGPSFPAREPGGEAQVQSGGHTPSAASAPGSAPTAPSPAAVASVPSPAASYGNDAKPAGAVVPETPPAAAVPDTPPAASEPEAFDLSDLLRSGTLPSDTESAFTTLFALWGLNYDQFTGKTACERALAAGLRCHHDRGNWTKLEQYGRPAVLELKDKDGRLHDAVLTALDDRNVTLNFGGREVSMPRSRVEPFWFGSFILLWRPPDLKSSLLKPGSSGEDVRWLKRQLAKAEGLEADRILEDKSAVFDKAVKQRVLHFQTANALVADGMVGEQTLILLTAVGENPFGPMLSARPGPGR